ncbi:MAG: glycosyltransferase family 4 protein [Candidatus Hydrothermae bacterium]|nr:glycosyltransferase family 4 protein [Candidatus Hydrothermae bacterium]
MNDPLRVWMIPDYSEANPYQRLLAEALSGLGVEVKLRSPAHPREMLTWDGLDVLHLHWYPFWFSRSWNGTRRRMNTFFRAVDRLQRQGVRMVYTVHNQWDHENALRGWHWRVLEQRALRRWARRVDGWVFHCREAQRAYPEARTRPAVVVPHPDLSPAYPPPPSRMEARRQLGGQMQSRMVLALGQIRPYKHLDRWVDLVKAVPGLEFWVVGTCKLPGGCAHLRRPRVRVLEGFVPEDQLPVYVAAADAVLIPQPRMLTSGVAALAMAWSRPVLVPRTGCNPELVPPDAGWMYDPEDVDDWKRVLQRVVQTSREDLERKGKAGQQWMKRHSAREMARVLKELYETLRGGPRR